MEYKDDQIQHAQKRDGIKLERKDRKQCPDLCGYLNEQRLERKHRLEDDTYIYGLRSR